MNLEEYMQALLRIGFSREVVLEKGLLEVTSHFGEGWGDSWSEKITILEEAASACGIDREAQVAEARRIEAEIQRQNEEIAGIRR